MLFYIKNRDGLYIFRNVKCLNNKEDIIFSHNDIDDNKHFEETSKLLAIVYRQSSPKEHGYVFDLLYDGVRVIEISYEEERFLLNFTFRKI